MMIALLTITLGPQLILFLGKVAIASSPWVGFKTEWTKLLPIVGGTTLISLLPLRRSHCCSHRSRRVADMGQRR